MCGWCCGRRDARTAFPQPRTAPSASTPGRSANATRFHSFGYRKVEAEEVRSSRGRERRPAKGRSTTTGNPSSLPTDTCAEPYSSCATERGTQRSPLGTQQGALPYVGPEPRPTAASSRRNEQGRATTGVPSANKVEPSWAHHTRSTDAAIRAGAVVHEAFRIPPPIVWYSRFFVVFEIFKQMQASRARQRAPQGGCGVKQKVGRGCGTPPRWIRRSL